MVALNVSIWWRYTNERKRDANAKPSFLMIERNITTKANDLTSATKCVAVKKRNTRVSLF